MELRIDRGVLRLPEEPPSAGDLADLAEMLEEAARADADRAGVQASDVLVVIAESAAAVLAASLRALGKMKPEPGPAARALAATYERYAAELAAIEAARSGAGLIMGQLRDVLPARVLASRPRSLRVIRHGLVASPIVSTAATVIFWLQATTS
jgi:hypothetical protein